MKYLLLVVCILNASITLARAEPVKLIFDTDMGNDVDDLMALSMIHSLQKRGAVELLAVTLTKDHPQAAAFTDAVNTPLVWSGFEIGVAAAFPHVVIERDLDYVAHHPFKEAYYLYQPPPHDRPTWDPTAVLYAALPDRGYFDLSPPGNVTVENDAATLFRPSPDGKGRHRFLVMSLEQTARVREAIVQLSVEPPSATK